MMMAYTTFLTVLLLLLGIALQAARAQDYDFSDPIKCYDCEGDAGNSSCADPFDEKKEQMEPKLCDRGMCLKWTKYKRGVLQMRRTCTDDVDFHLTMIDGVCRTERNGNGYLCMCGKSLCNSAPREFVPGMGWTRSQVVSFWLTSGLLFLFPHWIFQMFWRESL